MSTEADWDEIGRARVVRVNDAAVLLRSASTGRELWFPRDMIDGGDRLKPGDDREIRVDGSYRHVWQRQLRMRLDPLSYRIRPENPPGRGRRKYPRVSAFSRGYS